jgi:hypothetical protein
VSAGATETKTLESFKHGKGNHMANYSIIKTLLQRIEPELVIVELGAYATYFADPLSKLDRDRVLLAIRRLEALRGAVNARIK